MQLNIRHDDENAIMHTAEFAHREACREDHPWWLTPPRSETPEQERQRRRLVFADSGGHNDTLI